MGTVVHCTEPLAYNYKQNLASVKFVCYSGDLHGFDVSVEVNETTSDA